MKPPRGLMLSAIGGIGPLLLRLLARTWSVRLVNRAPYDRLVLNGPGCVAALWHEMILPGAMLFRDMGIYLMISRSRDGEVSAAVTGRLGFRHVRGSSSRGGGMALERLIRSLKGNGRCALTVDGPRGPAHEVKPGCILLARETGLPILPLGCTASPLRRGRNWDRTLLPLPFAHVTVAFEEPIMVPPEASGDEIDRLRVEVGRAIDAATERARRAAES